MCLYLVRKHMDGAVYKKSAILQVLVCLFQSTLSVVVPIQV